MTSCAISDHGTLAGIVDFYTSMKKAELHPLVGCLLEGQEIVTDNGVKNIEDIKIGDNVLTHKGRFKKVINVFSRDYSGLIYEIQLTNRSRTLKLTEEHPILVLEREKANKWHQEKFSDPKWKKPGEIKTGKFNKHHAVWNYCSYVCLPKLETNKEISLNLSTFLSKKRFKASNIRNRQIIQKIVKYNKHDSFKKWNLDFKFSITEDFCYFLGLYVAEGSTNFNKKKERETGEIRFTFNINEIEYANFILSFLEKKWKLKGKIFSNKDKSTLTVYLHCKPLAEILNNICGKGAKNKKVPNFIFSLPKILKDKFIDGVLDGDGKKNNGTIKISSRNLCWGMRILLADQGYWGSITEGEDTLNKKKYKYYMLNICKSRKYARTIEDDKFIYKSIQSIDKYDTKTKVYNIEVEEDNSYVSDFILHNCESYCSFDQDNQEEKTRDNHHLLILAKNNAGYKQLLKLSSEAFMNNFYYKPRICFDKIKDLVGNAIITSACMGGILSAGLEYSEDNQKLVDKDNRSEGLCLVLKTLFKDDFYLELQDWNDPTGQLRLYNQFILSLGRKHDIPFVITNDVHYLKKEDYLLHEVMMAMQMKMTLEQYRNNPKTLHYGTDFYLKDSNEMLKSAKELDCEEAYYNTGKIAEQCNVEIELGKYYPPKYDITRDKDYTEFLKWKNKIGENNGTT